MFLVPLRETRVCWGDAVGAHCQAAAKLEPESSQWTVFQVVPLRTLARSAPVPVSKGRGSLGNRSRWFSEFSSTAVV